MRMNNSSFNKVIKALYCLQDSISLSGSLTVELEERLGDELDNNPELFFVEGLEYIYDDKRTLIYPEYCYDKSSVNYLLEACRIKATQLVSRINTDDSYSKALQAHDFLARNVNYVKGDLAGLHSMVGPFTRKQGVCDGFSKAYKYMLDKMGIPCKIVRGHAGNPHDGSEELHAWNMIQIRDKWMHVDVTFDTTIRSGKDLRYDYFGLTDNQILKDHVYKVKEYPKANCSEYSYYERKR